MPLERKASRFRTMTATEKILELRAEDPHLTATELAPLVGVSRQRVSQILQSEGMPTRTPRTYAHLTEPRSSPGVTIHIPGGPRLSFTTTPKAKAWLEACIEALEVEP